MDAPVGDLNGARESQGDAPRSMPERIGAGCTRRKIPHDKESDRRGRDQGQRDAACRATVHHLEGKDECPSTHKCPGNTNRAKTWHAKGNHNYAAAWDIGGESQPLGRRSEAGEAPERKPRRRDATTNAGAFHARGKARSDDFDGWSDPIEAGRARTRRHRKDDRDGTRRGACAAGQARRPAVGGRPARRASPIASAEWGARFLPSLTPRPPRRSSATSHDVRRQGGIPGSAGLPRREALFRPIPGGKGGGRAWPLRPSERAGIGSTRRRHDADAGTKSRAFPARAEE